MTEENSIDENMKNLDIAIVLYNTKNKQVIKIIDAPGVSEAIQLANKNQSLNRQSMYDEDAATDFEKIFENDNDFEKYKEENMITSEITMGEHNMLVTARGKDTAFEDGKNITNVLKEEDKKTLKSILTREKDTEGFSDESQKQLTRLVEKQIMESGTDEQKKALATAKKYPRAALKIGGRMAAGIYQKEINNLLDNVDKIDGLKVDGVKIDKEMIEKKKEYIKNNKSTIIANVVDTLTETDEERKKNIEKENATGEKNEVNEEEVDENATEKGVEVNENVAVNPEEENPEDVNKNTLPSQGTGAAETATDPNNPPSGGGASNLRKSHKKRKQTKRKNPKKQSKRKNSKNKKAS